MSRIYAIILIAIFRDDTDLFMYVMYSVCKVCVKVWPYLRVLIENNNYMYSWLGFLPLTIVGEVCHAIR